MTSAETRQSFLDFFQSKEHTVVPSSSLLPSSPNLLFTNAGMNQFVPYFLGSETPPFAPARAADTQKCIRAGGKHNDLDDVGLDTYHHTFFEMLGNWSFGDYFKQEAITWAWELVVKKWNFPAERLYATVYAPADGDPGEFDQEAYDIWAEQFRSEGLDPAVHIVNGNREDNFWMMGETGPCGPCSELHIDLTPLGDTKGSLVNAGDARCMEIWNLVFIQYNAEADGSFRPLPACHVDTGMGFERVCSIIQGTKNFQDFSKQISNYDTDVFSPILQQITKLSGHPYTQTIPTSRANQSEQEKIDVAFRVIADHIRTLSFSIADGILPGNKDRNFVLRRILRRAVRFGRILGLGKDSKPFLPQIAEVVIQQFGSFFPELVAAKNTILQTLETEETNFNRTLDRGLELFQQVLSSLPNGTTEFPADTAFKLYDTYGFPLDLTEVMAAEANLQLDQNKVDALMKEQRERARAARKSDVIAAEDSISDVNTEFVGFEQDNAETTIDSIISRGEDLFAIVTHSPLYAEMGGQVGDTGTLQFPNQSIPILDTIKKGNTFYLKLAEAPESDANTATIELDLVRRRAIERHHTATHLLHWALHEVVGDSVSQKGSYVGPDRLRFDFNSSALTPEQIQEIEDRVNSHILANHPVSWKEVEYSTIQDRSDIMQFFGEKYGKFVRVVQIGGQPHALDGFSMELCGGTHVRATGQLGQFQILSEGAISAGIRRIEAVTGTAAIEHVRNCVQSLESKVQELTQKSLELQKTLEKERAAILQQSANQIVDALLADNPKHIIHQQSGTADLLQTILTTIKQRGFTGASVLFVTEADDKVHLGALVPDTLQPTLHAGKLIQQIAPVLDGKGGGKPDMARGAGKSITKLPDAIATAQRLLN